MLDGIGRCNVVIDDVGQGVFQPVGRQARGVVVGNRVEVVVGNVADCKSLLLNELHDFGGVLDEVFRASFCRFLFEVVAIEKVYHMGERGGGDVVEQGGDGLAHIVGEVPNDEGAADAVFIA